MKSKTTAIILAVFLGWFGGHRFYLGQVGTGLLYLIFCWTFIPAIIAFIDFIIFLKMDEQTFNIRYNDSMVLGITPRMNPAVELEKLHSLKVKGIITEFEFENRILQLI